jgi:hypothetical protein
MRETVANHVFDALLTPQMHTELVQLTSRIQITQLKDGWMAIFKDNVQMANKYIKKNTSTSLIIKEMEIKTTVRWDLLATI